MPGGFFEYSPGVFFTSEASCRDYDWLVCYDELPAAENLACSQTRTILATCEPMSIKCYSRAYAAQFGHLLTNRPEGNPPHVHYHLGRGYYKWFCDKTIDVAKRPVGPKTKTISAVCSSKQMKHTSHHARFKLISGLAQSIPDFDWYGRGVRSFGRKFEVMDPYRYHVAVENHIAPHHWTEKLSDAFLCECLPFYAGDPAISECFPSESLIPIPIDDPHAASRIIAEAIAADEYTKRREAILEAKRRIIEKYNFWQQVLEVIHESEAESLLPEDFARVTLMPRKELRRRNLSAALEEGWFHFKQYIGAF